ncbi:hypothetical protein GQ600_9237 [Phytophthora cactorum]|nr:hypothetical protein GQ600_9237 [Phytophthora cactorum]
MEKIAGTTVGFARRKTTNREAERCTRPKKNTDGDTTMAGLHRPTGCAKAAEEEASTWCLALQTTRLELRIVDVQREDPPWTEDVVAPTSRRARRQMARRTPVGTSL